MAKTKIFVSVRDRVKQTLDCINSLVATTHGLADIYIFDNGSSDEHIHLCKLYYEWTVSGRVASVVLNRRAAMPGVYWSKNFAWTQFMDLVRLLPKEERQYLVMVDNDVVFNQQWLERSLEVLEDPQADEFNVQVVSPYLGTLTYDNQSEGTIAGVEVLLRKAHNCPCWVARGEWWLGFEAPPWGIVEREGEKDRMPTDNWYYEGMAQWDQLIAVFKEPLVTDPLEPWPSARFHFGIGADVRKHMNERDKTT